MSKELNFYEALEVMRKGGVVLTPCGVPLSIKNGGFVVRTFDNNWVESSYSANALLDMEYRVEPKPVKMVDKWLWADNEFTYTNFFSSTGFGSYTIKLEWSKTSFPEVSSEDN